MNSVVIQIEINRPSSQPFLARIALAAAIQIMEDASADDGSVAHFDCANIDRAIHNAGKSALIGFDTGGNQRIGSVIDERAAELREHGLSWPAMIGQGT